MPAISGTMSKWINIVIAILGVIVAGGPHIFPAYVPELWANDIVQTAAFVVAIFGGVNAVLHVAGGPGVSPTIARTLVAGAIMAACLLSIASPSTARAATLTATASDPLTLFISGLTTAIKNGTTSLLADLQAADTDAIAHNDTISDPCYKAEISFVQGIPSLASPAGPIGPIQLFQIKRDVQNAFAGGIPASLKLACGPLWLDEQGTFAKFTAALAAAGIVLAK